MNPYPFNAQVTENQISQPTSKVLQLIKRKTWLHCVNYAMDPMTAMFNTTFHEYLATTVS